MEKLKEKKSIDINIIKGKKKKVMTALIVFVCAAVIAGSYNIYANGYMSEQLTFETSSLNGNTIWSATESYKSATLDGHGGFYSAQRNSSGGLPTDGRIYFGGVSYKLQIRNKGYYAYNGNDCVKLTNGNRVRTIEFDDDQSYDRLYILATAGGPGKGNYVNFNVKVTYSDGSTSTSSYRMYDWFDTKKVSGVDIYKSPRRVLTTTGAYDGKTDGGPVLRGCSIDTDATKVIRSVTFSMAGLNGSSSKLNSANVNCAVYAITGQYKIGVPGGRLYASAGGAYGSGFTMFWWGGSNADYYCVDVSPYADFRSMVSGYNNRKVTGTSLNVTGLKPDTTYYYRVRAVNENGCGRNSEIESVYTYVPNTAYVNLTLDDEGWTGKNVALYQKGQNQYTLYANTDGSYHNYSVKNGTYDIFIDGKDSGENVTFNYKGSNMYGGDTITTNIDYDTLTVTTRLDDTVSTMPGDLELRQDGVGVYTCENENGTMSLIVKNTANDTYRVYVNNRDTGKTVDVVANTTMTLDYYEMLMGLQYPEALTDAGVTLCNESGVIQETLDYKGKSGNTYYYSKILIKDNQETPVTYWVFANGQNTHQTVQALSGCQEANAAFYISRVTVNVDGVPDTKLKVSMSNGMESYVYARENNVFVNKYTLVNDTSGSEAPYVLSVRGALRPETANITESTPDTTLHYQSVKYMIPSLNGWVPYMTQYVKTGEITEIPAAPDYGLIPLESWCVDEALESPYDFASVVNSSVILYAKFQEPHIVINDYIRTDEEGVMDGEGGYYRMPNLSINGYKESACMDSIAFETTGCDEFIILDDTVIESVLPTYENGKVNIESDGTMVIMLKDDVDVLAVQDFLRDGIVVRPQDGETHTMKITVYGDDGNED